MNQIAYQFEQAFHNSGRFCVPKRIGIVVLFVLGLHWRDAAAIQDAMRPYAPGSVYNLANFLPWQESGPEIVPYPIGCSVNRIADFSLQLLFPEEKGPFTKVFASECKRHDLCYRHGYYTYEFTKNDCDDEFEQGLENRCAREFRNAARTQCQNVADILVLAARKFGHLSYHADDYPFRDYGYYYEYLNNRAGQYALLWSMLNPHAQRPRLLYRQRVNENKPLPAEPSIRRLLFRFFKKKIGMKQLIASMKGFTRR